MMLRSLFCFLVWTSSLFAQAISTENFVPNKSGTCWWACAEMIGRQFKIPGLIGLQDKVIATGIGHKTGASRKDIEHWLTTLQVRAEFVQGPNKDTDWLIAKIKKKLPVLVNIYMYDSGGRLSSETHSVIIVKLEVENGKQMVTYTDPNNARTNYTLSFASFVEYYWTGTAYVFDPNEQRRLLFADTTDPALKTKATQILASHLGVVGYEVKPQVTKSNQDIKDGVNRPDDLFRIPIITPDSVDYYQEFRQKNKTNFPER